MGFKPNKSNKSEVPKTGTGVSKDGTTPGKRKEIGALWERISKKNETYFKVKLVVDGKEIWVNAFKNRQKKEGSSQPDYVIFEEQEKSNDVGTGAT